MPTVLRNLDLRHIFLDPTIPCRPTDDFDLFVFISRDMQQMTPLPVRRIESTDNYHVLSSGPEYVTEHLLIAGAKKVGLSQLQCVVPTESLAQSCCFLYPPTSESPALVPSTVKVTLPDENLIARSLEVIAGAAGRLAASIRRRGHSTGCWLSDEDDWTQEALLELWISLKNGLHRGEVTRDEIVRNVSKTISNQARKAARTRNVRPLLYDPSCATETIVDEMIFWEQQQVVASTTDKLEELIDVGEGALSLWLGGLTKFEAKALVSWLKGDTYLAGASGGGIGVARLRKLIGCLRNGSLAPLLSRIHSDLRALFHASPQSAGCIDLGRLKRILPDPAS